MNTSQLKEQQKQINIIEAQSKILQYMLDYIMKGNKDDEINDKND